MGITLQIYPQNGASSRYPCPAGVCLVLMKYSVGAPSLVELEDCNELEN